MTNEYGRYWNVYSNYEDYEMHEQKAGPKRAFCRACERVVQDWYPRPIEANLMGVRRAVTIATRRIGAYVLHADLWRQIAPMCPSAVIGPVTARRGDLDAFTIDWVTLLFPSDEHVHIRGRRPYLENPDDYADIIHRICSECNREICYTANSENFHLVRATIQPMRPVLMNSFRDLLIAEEVARTLDWSGFPDLRYDVVPVLERPMDGLRLQGDPDWSAMP
jgi:hypothetical protein